ncbi:MAG: hypothetical protein CM1200mP18_21920 [Gammaproteobacteria bacterium]|nr:MAG: hypothetical protein CM1200mP18_21920 [Gammaproteobacteria bacterium]
MASKIPGAEYVFSLTQGTRPHRNAKGFNSTVLEFIQRISKAWGHRYGARPVDSNLIPDVRSGAWGFTSQERSLQPWPENWGPNPGFSERAAVTTGKHISNGELSGYAQSGLLGICIPQSDGGHGARCDVMPWRPRRLDATVGYCADLEHACEFLLWSGALTDDLEWMVRFVHSITRIARYTIGEFWMMGNLCTTVFEGGAALGAVAFGTTAQELRGAGRSTAKKSSPRSQVMRITTVHCVPS